MEKRGKGSLFSLHLERERLAKTQRVRQKPAAIARCVSGVKVTSVCFWQLAGFDLSVCVKLNSRSAWAPSPLLFN